MKTLLTALLWSALLHAQPMRLAPGDFVWQQFRVTNHPTALDVRFHVVNGTRTIHMEIMSMSEFRQFSRRREYEPLATTQDGTDGQISRMMVDEGGEFAAVLENAERAPAAMVELEIRTDLNPNVESMARVLPPGRRLAVILISFGIFFVTVTWSGWKLLKATGKT